jgi:hypothetical protein
MEATERRNNPGISGLASPAQEAEVERPPAWELVEAGRYRPRRIRGSLLGRELG